MEYTSAEEMYLLTVKRLAEKNGYVRNNDVADTLGVYKSTASEGLSKLKAKNLIVNNNGEILLTSKGLQIAIDVEQKHTAIVEALVKIGADKQIAENNACLIEHVITDELKEVLIGFAEDKE